MFLCLHHSVEDVDYDWRWCLLVCLMMSMTGTTWSPCRCSELWTLATTTTTTLHNGPALLLRVTTTTRSPRQQLPWQQQPTCTPGSSGSLQIRWNSVQHVGTSAPTSFHHPASEEDRGSCYRPADQWLQRRQRGGSGQADSTSDCRDCWCWRTCGTDRKWCDVS